MSVEEAIERRLIQEILGNTYDVGSYLPPERKLAENLGYSRPAIHKALIRLEGKGLITIIPRQGVRVNDYRITGKLDLLDTLYRMYKWEIDEHIHRSTFHFIKENLLTVLQEISQKPSHHKKEARIPEPEDLFTWIQAYAMASDNFIYPLLFNEFKVGIMNVSKCLFYDGGKEYQAVRDRVDQEVKDGNLEGVSEALDDLFQLVEFHWLKRCKSEAASGGKDFFKGGLR